MEQVVRRDDMKRSERSSPNSRRAFKGFTPLAEPPKRSIRELVLAAVDKAKGLRKALESPDEALRRAADEPIDEAVILAPYKERPVFKLH